MTGVAVRWITTADPAAMILAALAIAVALPCGPTTSDVHGHVLRCTLDKEATVAGAKLPAKSIAFFDANGVLNHMFLSRDAIIGGHACRGGAEAWETGFYPDGKLRLCWLAADETIDGVSCRKSTNWTDAVAGTVGVRLSIDGHLRQCESAIDQRLGACDVKMGNLVKVDDAGALTVNGQRCK